MSKQSPQLFRVYLVAKSLFKKHIIDTGRHSEETITNLFQALAQSNPTKSDCIKQISGSLSNGYIAHCLTNENEKYFYQTDIHNHVTLNCSFGRKCKCHKSQCLGNIKSGKCANKFVQSTIGIYLFPEYYSKQK